MNSKEYINNAVRTESRDFEAIGKRLSEESNIRLLHGAIGLATESGEFLDALKKHIYYGKELDRVNLAEELGDLFGIRPLLLMSSRLTLSQLCLQILLN